MLSGPLLAIVLPVGPHHAGSAVPWALFGVIAGNLATLITILILGIWGFRLGAKHQGGNGPGGGGPRKPSPQSPPPSGGRSPVSDGLPGLDLRDFSAWEAEMESEATPNRQDHERVSASARLGALAASPQGSGRARPAGHTPGRAVCARAMS
jgi:hypothetical protein